MTINTTYGGIKKLRLELGSLTLLLFLFTQRIHILEY